MKTIKEIEEIRKEKKKELDLRNKKFQILCEKHILYVVVQDVHLLNHQKLLENLKK